MYKKYHDGLIDKINTIANVTAKKYFGELENPQEGKFIKGSLPTIYIDFIEDDTTNPRTIETYFSLYIVHIAYSKNEEIRTATHTEMHDLLKEIYKQLAFKPIEDSKPIEMKKLQKIYDANAAGGYVTVYKKDISMSVPNPIITGEI